MIDASTARLKFSNVNRGAFDGIRAPCHFILGPSAISVPMTKTQAASYKAGYRVVITGCPSFSPGTGNQLKDAFLQVNSFVSFQMQLIGDARFIGAISLNQVKYDIFDSKNETVQ
jgi:hypothetical protein